MPHTLPALGYAYDALEPHIDARTMEIHHTKHHQAYVDRLNAALAKRPELDGKDVAWLLRNLDKLPEDIRSDVRNHGGGVWNHAFFWKTLKKGTKPHGPVLDAINRQWGGFDAFKKAFSEAAMGRFGSGWAWLGLDTDGRIHIGSTANQDSPVSEGHTPLLAIDVWEHAYYLKYQNRRNEYVEAFWNVIDWDEVDRRYQEAKK
ncbi:superoxide dismutase [Candidatus Woesearchaeota archaeon]|nr:superoxide dismutase [Candidatus Woesearchaeota archaeon]